MTPTVEQVRAFLDSMIDSEADDPFCNAVAIVEHVGTIIEDVYYPGDTNESDFGVALSSLASTVRFWYRKAFEIYPEEAS